MAGQRLELDDVVEPVHELRLELRLDAGASAGNVRGHDQDGVLEADRAALAIGQAAVVHHLQQRVEHVGVGLLDLVEQDDGVRAPPHRLGQLAALVVADVAGRRADEPRDGVLLHVLGHVDPDHRVLGVEHELGQRTGQLGLADAGRARGTGTCRSAGRGPAARRASAGARSTPPRPPRPGRSPAGAAGPPCGRASRSRPRAAATPARRSTSRRPRRRRRRRPRSSGIAPRRHPRPARPRRACARARG